LDRTQNLVGNWVFDLPKASRLWSNALTKVALDNWQISGILTMRVGAPTGVSYSLVTATDITGTYSEGSRVVVLANPNIPNSEKTFFRNFNTAAFAPPAVGTFGNAARTVLRYPGQNNWDIAVVKNFPLRWEGLRAEFRAEMYNAPNHTQFSAFDTGARFDATGKQVNANFGAYTSAFDARTMQMLIKFSF
jgi:hypothetical protein